MHSDTQHRPVSSESSTGTPWKRAVSSKIGALGVALLLWLAMFACVYSFHSANLANGGQARTMAEADPGIARAILIGLALFLIVEMCSLSWRIARRSSRIGVTGIVIAGLACTAPLLFAFTPIGFVLLPFAGLGVFVALPIVRNDPTVSNPYVVAPPGWYTDPFLVSRFRYWDGTSWTPWTA